MMENVVTYDKPAHYEVIEAASAGVVTIVMEKKEAEEQYKLFSTGMAELMTKYGVKSFENEEVKITLLPASTAERFDAQRFKEEHPDLYIQYLKEVETKQSVRITLRKKNNEKD